MMNFYGQFRAPSNYSGFHQSYKVFPISVLDRPELDGGGKIIMPPSSLQRMATLELTYPLLFELSNSKFPQRKVHCGVLEFVAEEGRIYVPSWMMQNMGVQIEDFVKLQTVTLPLGTFVKFQPQSSSFLEISNPKAVLENILRSYATLGVNETIMIKYNKKDYFLTILEVKPVHPTGAISIIETDISVDFAPPADQPLEPEKKPAEKAASTKEEEVQEESTTFKPFTGGGYSIKRGQIAPSSPVKTKSKPKDDSDSDPEEEDEKPKFKAFSGSGYSLKGKR